MMNQLRISIQIVYFTIIIRSIVQSIEITLENGQTGNVDKRISVGDTNVTLLCSASDNAQVIWTYRATETDSSELILVEENALYPQTDKTRHGLDGTNLIIKRAASRDAGFYECRATLSNEAQVGRGLYNLTVEGENPVFSYENTTVASETTVFTISTTRINEEVAELATTNGSKTNYKILKEILALLIVSAIITL